MLRRISRRKISSNISTNVFSSSRRSESSCVLLRHPGVENAVSKDCFEIHDETTSTCSLSKGEVEVQTVYLSVDPYMRCRFDGADHSQLPQYVEPFRLNETPDGGGIGKVLRSNHENVRVNDWVCMPFVGYPWKTQCVLDLSELDDNSNNKNLTLDTFLVAANEIEENQLSHLLGAVGMPGLTAYCGIHFASPPQEGHTVVISAAAGAVGSIAGQIVRVERGARVVGICGSDEKCKILEKTLQFDVALNYKSPDFEKHLFDALSDSGFDIYFDSVGGTVSESVLRYANTNAQVPICGQIAQYETNVSYDSLVSSDAHFSDAELRKFLQSQNVSRFRYLVLDYEEHFASALDELKSLCSNEKITALETRTQGFHPHDAFVDMMAGKNLGKAIIKI